MTENIFQKIKDDLFLRVEKKKKEVKQVFETSEKEKKRVETIKKEAHECSSFMQDARYDSYQSFLEALQKTLYKKLQTVGNVIKNREELVLEVARVSAQLTLLDELINRPDKVLKMVKVLDKEPNGSK